MLQGTTPRWLIRLERVLGWIAVPNLALILATLQVLGFLMVASEPAWLGRLALVPEAVLAGEAWRLVTWLAIPVTASPIWLFFALWFLYFVLNTIENEWGAFRTTFYVLLSIVVTTAYSFALDFPIAQAAALHSTLFLAAAALYPEYEIRLYLIFPVKMKWLALLTVVLVSIQAFQAGWLGRGYLLAIYSNYLLFFGPSHLNQLRYFIRRQRNRNRFR